MIFIENALVLRDHRVAEANALIDGDTVIEVGAVSKRNGARVIDAGGAWLGPGLVDVHVHFRDPGQTWKEDLGSGARAAAAGGYTAVLTMPNTEPPIDSGPRAVEAMARAREVETVEIAVAGTLTRGRGGQEVADIDAMYRAGVRVFTDDGECVADASLLRRIMSSLAALPGALVAEHPEDSGLAGDGQINEGELSALHGLVGLPGVAEDVIVARDLAIARDTGARIHIQHVSTAASVALIRQAREDRVAVTAEVTPHHLALEDGALVDLDPNLKMYPPLRDRSDREAMVRGLRAGVIDAVATDHAPHAAAEKSLPFEEAPRGVIGLETAAPVVAVALEQDQVIFFQRMSRAPARIAGLSRQGIAVEPGSPANLVLFDPMRSWTPAGFASKSENTPFRGLEMMGKVLATIHEGRITHEVGL